MEFMSAKETAELWGISQRRVATLCAANRVEGAATVGNMWIIPKGTKKPVDARTFRYSETWDNKAKPFLKWAGGKGQLLKEIERYYIFDDKGINKYAEPFVGGGAVLFDVLNKFSLEAVYVSDVNRDLIETYIVVRDHLDDMLEYLASYELKFSHMDQDERKAYYMIQRGLFNKLKYVNIEACVIEKSALMVFLNKTCFNGLYRVNRKGLFNVPVGAYKNPCICDQNNLKAVSEKLQNVQIVCGDYRNSADFIDDNTFVYFDPPYRPLTATASFTSYTETQFDDERQRELANYVNFLNEKGAKIVVSNSDPKNVDDEDNFFDEIYAAHNIKRVEAVRMINSKASKRGKIKELLITNF